MEPYFVVNPASGAGRTARLWRMLGRGLHFALTRGPGHATELTAEALARGEGLVVAVGGDGTVNEALNGFYDKGRPRRAGSTLAMLPCGTGGDLARTLGIDRVPAERLLAGLKGGRVLQLDCGVARFAGQAGPVERRFLNVSSVGFSASIVQKVNRKSKALGGKLAFLSAVFRSLASLRSEVMSISVDGGSMYEGPVLLAAVANGRFFGGSMMIAPDAEPADGLFDVVVVAGLTRPQVVRHVAKLYSGRHVSLPQVSVRRGRLVTIRCGSRAPLEMDGEQPGGLDASFELHPASVPFLVPEPAGAR
jgi:YegS/Rv2252/BmrU family lipid kinase